MAVVPSIVFSRLKKAPFGSLSTPKFALDAVSPRERVAAGLCLLSSLMTGDRSACTEV